MIVVDDGMWSLSSSTTNMQNDILIIVLLLQEYTSIASASPPQLSKLSYCRCSCLSNSSSSFFAHFHVICVLLLAIVLHRFPRDGEHHGIDPVAHNARLQASEKETIPPKESVLGANLVKSFNVAHGLLGRLPVGL